MADLFDTCFCPGDWYAELPRTGDLLAFLFGDANLDCCFWTVSPVGDWDVPC